MEQSRIVNCGSKSTSNLPPFPVHSCGEVMHHLCFNSSCSVKEDSLLFCIPCHGEEHSHHYTFNLKWLTPSMWFYSEYLYNQLRELIARIEQQSQPVNTQLRRAIERFERQSAQANPFGWGDTLLGVGRRGGGGSKSLNSLLEDLRSVRCIFIAGGSCQKLWNEPFSWPVSAKYPTYDLYLEHEQEMRKLLNSRRSVNQNDIGILDLSHITASDIQVCATSATIVACVPYTIKSLTVKYSGQVCTLYISEHLQSLHIAGPLFTYTSNLYVQGYGIRLVRLTCDLVVPETAVKLVESLPLLKQLSVTTDVYSVIKYLPVLIRHAIRNNYQLLRLRPITKYGMDDHMIGVLASLDRQASDFKNALARLAVLEKHPIIGNSYYLGLLSEYVNEYSIGN